MLEQTYKALKPTRLEKIYDLVKAAGVDVAIWEKSVVDNRALNPYSNSYRNSQWAFGGGNEPLVACIWWREIAIKDIGLVLEGSSKADVERMSDSLAVKGKDPSIAMKLRNKITKAQQFDRLVSEAYRKRKPVRTAILDGKLSVDDESDPSSAEARELDLLEWFVHEYDPFSGRYLMVRNVPMPSRIVSGPFDDAEDPADDKAFQEFMSNSPLSETEKEAVIKTRVGQGYFRDQLLKRWTGCSVTKVTEPSILVASHIKPWRECITRAERLSPDNGLLLSPTLDKLFDRGLISFDENNRYTILISKKLGAFQASEMHLLNQKIRPHSYEGMRPYMKYHRENVFIDNIAQQ
ncbi:HNH endonuclease [Burkholderia cenocepacia]|uniref:HNH endonuclease n=2 Tax=Burkholderia cenocepacia TaxID=95486 RepID=UPI001903353B|nr:HNH endonuclease [Burkholderia cenocepacia]MBJ9697102.1 HNH endonuclease [Burkholderia cenocepacia]